MKKVRTRLITACMALTLLLGPVALVKASATDPQGGNTTGTQQPNTSPSSPSWWDIVAIILTIL